MKTKVHLTTNNRYKCLNYTAQFLEIVSANKILIINAVLLFFYLMYFGCNSDRQRSLSGNCVEMYIKTRIFV